MKEKFPVQEGQSFGRIVPLRSRKALQTISMPDLFLVMMAKVLRSNLIIYVCTSNWS